MPLAAVACLGRLATSTASYGTGCVRGSTRNCVRMCSRRLIFPPSSLAEHQPERIVRPLFIWTWKRGTMITCFGLP